MEANGRLAEPRRVMHLESELGGQERDLRLLVLLRAFSSRYKLSARESDVIQVAVSGLSDKEAATALRVSDHTVRSYWNRIFRKTALHSQRDVVATLLRFALSSP